ncbi:MAG TPA: after-VIT domain-containing protein, partial [Coleofasciculaceae cyanobacterium]
PRSASGRGQGEAAPAPIQPITPTPADVNGNIGNPPPQPGRVVQVVSAAGLDARAIGQLTQYLQTGLPAGLTGEFVVMLTVEKGAIVGVVLDDSASTALTAEQSTQLRQALLRWQGAPQGVRSIRLQFTVR